MKQSNERKKVAFVATVYRHLEAFHLPYMRLLQEWGYEVHAFAHEDRGTAGVAELGILCHHIPFQRNPYHPKNLAALRQLLRHFQSPYTFIHLHTPVAALLGRIAGRMAKVPHMLYTAHGFHFFRGAPWHHWLLYYPLERFLARWTDVLITINEEDYRRASTFPVQQKVYHLPGIGVDTRHFQLPAPEQVRRTLRRQLGLEKNDFAILCVAELNRNKNQIQLLQAVQSLVQQYPAVKVLLVGEGQEQKRLRQWCRRQGLEQHVRFLGFRRDIPELLAAADVVTLLSRREGLPRALLEALAAGKPIVATRIRGNRDLVIPGHNGFLVPLDDPLSTARAFESLIQSPSLRQRMGQNSRAMSSRYDLSVTLEQMAQIYRLASSSMLRLTIP